jgi:hypothetical protein
MHAHNLIVRALTWVRCVTWTFFSPFFFTEEALKCNTNFSDAVEWCINKLDDAPNEVLNGAALGRQAAKKKSDTCVSEHYSTILRNEVCYWTDVECGVTLNISGLMLSVVSH